MRERENTLRFASRSLSRSLAKKEPGREREGRRKKTAASFFFFFPSSLHFFFSLVPSKVAADEDENLSLSPVAGPLFPSLKRSQCSLPRPRRLRTRAPPPQP